MYVCVRVRVCVCVQRLSCYLELVLPVVAVALFEPTDLPRAGVWVCGCVGELVSK